MVAASLPDVDALDLQAMKAMLIDRHESYTATLSSPTREIKRLVLLVEKLQRMLFGKKSDKVLRQMDQLELHLEKLQAADAIGRVEGCSSGRASCTGEAVPSPTARACSS